ELKNAFSNGMKAIDASTARLPDTFPKPIRTAMNAGLEVLNSGFDGMLNIAGGFMPKLNNSGNKFNPARNFKRGTDKAKAAVGSGVASIGKEIRSGSNRAANQASGF